MASDDNRMINRGCEKQYLTGITSLDCNEFVVIQESIEKGLQILCNASSHEAYVDACSLFLQISVKEFHISATMVCLSGLQRK